MKAIDILNCKSEEDAIDYLVEVEIQEGTFLKVMETLTRIGIPGAPDQSGKPILNQTCHILSKRGKYYICHFKTMFVLDDRENRLTTGDIARQNLIISLLEDWGLIKVKDRSMIDDPVCSLKTLKVVPYQEKDQWNLKAKYKLGKK